VFAGSSPLGLNQAYQEPITPEELSDDLDSEIESNTTASWNLTDAAAHPTNSVLDNASKGVSDNTYDSYVR
jgi:hypothetical protein